MIVGSILLAFGIDAWWDDVQQDRSEEAVLASLLEEFEANRAEFDLVGDRHEFIYESGLAVLRVGYGLSEPDSGFVTQAEWVWSYELRLDVATRALDSYLASNDVALIASTDLRSRIADFQSSLDGLWQQEGMIRELVRNDIAQAISRDYDLLLVGTGSGSDELVLLRDAAFETNRRDTLLQVAQDPLIRNLTTARVGREYQAVLRLESLRMKYESILVLLRERLASVEDA